MIYNEKKFIACVNIIIHDAREEKLIFQYQ